MQTMIIVDLILLAGIVFVMGCIVNQSIEIDLLKQRVRRSEAPDEATESRMQALQDLADQAQELKMGYETADDEAETK